MSVGFGGALAATRQVSGSAPISGSLEGLPKEAGISVSVEAVALHDNVVAAAEVVSGARYSLVVPPGAYLVVASATDPRHHRVQNVSTAVEAKGATTANLKLTLRKLSSTAAPSGSQSSQGPVSGIGDIPITGPDGKLPGEAELGDYFRDAAHLPESGHPAC